MLGKVGTACLPPSEFKLMPLISALSRNLCSESLFNLVISLSRERIHGRLQSVHWKVPTHLRGATREPLHQELRKIAARLEQQRRQMPADSKKLIRSLYELCDYYQQINSCKKHTNEELQLLKDAIRHSHALATSNGKCTIEETVSNHGLDSREICSNKVIKQLNKIGRYWGLCIDMAEASRKYGEIFKNLELKTLPPYQAIRSSISFVKGKIARCHVHAEIQLLTFYDLNLNLATAKPRVLGVSKSACYLCNMFILKHGQFFITKTHGRLYDQWNVPDLVEFGQAQRNAFRQVLSSMNRDIQTNLIRGRRSVHRDFPLGSYVNLPENIPQSVVHSSAATLEPVELPGIVRHVESEARPPQAQSTPSAPQPTRHIGSSVTPIPLTTLPKSIESSPHRPAMSPISGPTDQPSETTFAITDSASTALSSTSIRSWEIPIQRTLTSKSSFWISDERLSAQIEFDGPGQGQVTVSGVTKTTTGLPKNPIDLSRLVPNETMQLRRAEADDSLVLGLNHGQCIMEITFHWLP